MTDQLHLFDDPALHQRAQAQHDYYPTPPWVAEKFLRQNLWLEQRGSDWLEPCAGTGAIISASDCAKDFWNASSPTWTALELRPECRQHLEQTPNIKTLLCPSDFLTYRPDRRHDILITNPPFSLAMEFVEHGLSVARTVIMLLRLGFIGTQGRADFHRRHKVNVQVIPERISFTGGGSDNSEYAWFLWGGPHDGEISVLY